MDETLKEEALIVLDRALNTIGYKVTPIKNDEHQMMIDSLLLAMSEFASYCCKLQRVNCAENARITNLNQDLAIYIVDQESILESELVIN
jgi:hypothetical protein